MEVHKNAAVRHARPALAAGLVVAALLAAGCGGTSGDRAACKKAMSRDFASALSQPNGPSATKPPECNGLSDKELNKIVGEIMSGQ
jgi:hypothetical protein